MTGKTGDVTRPRSGFAPLRPRARLIGLIGEDLISDEPVAVVELVKNAYDADATYAEVRFEGKDPTRPDEIVVLDDGIGMNLETVLEGWFEPGTITKRRQDRSPRGRLYQGSKGIGRFAAARLAKKLLIETKRRGTAEGVVVELNWKDFDEASYLDEIMVKYEVRPVGRLNHGTRLTLRGLRKQWSEEDYKEVHARLSRLISPFEEVSGFKVLLEIPAHPELSGVVEPPALILEPIYLLNGRVTSDGYFTGTLQVDGRMHKQFDRTKIGGAHKEPTCGPFQVEIRAWDRDPDGLEPIAQRMSLSIQEIRSTLNTYSGVSIYRDGFRVYPYGQRGNDWLNLDIRSRQVPGRNLANNQVIAAIRISRDENPALRDRSNREGMVLNAEHGALERWFVEVLSLLEEERYRLRPRRESPDRTQPLFEAFDIRPLVEGARRELGKDHPLTQKASRAQEEIRTAVERLQEVFSRLLLSAGVGHLVDIVIHEIGSPLGKLNRQVAILEQAVDEYPLDGDLRVELLKMVEPMNGWLEQIHSLRQRLDPQTAGRRGRATTFNVRDELEDNFNLYESLIKRQRIEYEIITPRQPVTVKMSRAALGQIVANLIDNSIYWIVRERGAGRGGRIQVRVRRLEHGFRLLFCDDGPGVAEEDRGRIFEPYFTRKPTGMGLGLYIARLVIEPYGKLTYGDECSLPGACFDASFERGVGL